MGVPCVTVTGACHAQNVSASLLTTVNLESSFVADTPAKYEDMAVAAVSDVDTLKALRSSLRERMLSSPLCDVTTFVRKLEGVYRNMWSTWLGGVRDGGGGGNELSVEDSADRLTESLQDASLKDRGEPRPRGSETAD